MHVPRYAPGCSAGQDAGQELPPALREALEHGLGADLSAVRVHTGPAADRLARALGAEAFASGSGIWFRAGAYRPGTGEGLRLLAHEAAHLVQQARGPVGGVPVGGLTISTPGDPWERAAEQCADRVLAGHTAPRRDGRTTVRPQAFSGVVQRHVSFEHRVLGDVPTGDLVAVSAGMAGRDKILVDQIKLVSLWQDNPRVSAEEIHRLFPRIDTVTLGPDGVVVTYGELNALPDYLPDAEAFDSLGADILVPILQVIRQEGYNQLTKLRTGNNPNKTFVDAACAPWQLSLVNNIVETTALDQLTRGLGIEGIDHYQGLLARNACHFAPYSWYRWQTSHIIARTLAADAFKDNNPQLKRRAQVYHGYADHFLQDSFAAGHLVNKTLISEWFVEWAHENLGWAADYIADWDRVRQITAGRQPGLTEHRLYDPAYQGPANDPQTVQEAATVAERIVRSGILPGTRGRGEAYQDYLAFLTNSITQLASATLHDHYNAKSLWVSSIEHPVPYEVWGDDTLLSGPNGARGVQATSAAATLSRLALTEILATGKTAISTEMIRRCFPTKAGTGQGEVQDLLTWNLGQKSFCWQTFDRIKPNLANFVTNLASPRLGTVSQDQVMTSPWYQNLGTNYRRTDTLVHAGRVFAGSDGWVLELDPVTGKVLHKLLLTSDLPDPVNGFETRLCTDGQNLYAGVHGYVYAVDLAGDWKDKKWATQLTGSNYKPVSVLWDSGRLLAGSNGYAYQLDPENQGRQLHYLLMTSGSGVGEYDTRLCTDGANLYAGVHGYVYAVDLAGDWKKTSWYASLKDSLYNTVSVLWDSGRLFAGSNGYAYQLDPKNQGNQLNRLVLTSRSGLGEYVTRLCTDGKNLYAGLYGYVYAIDLDGGWKQLRWSRALQGLTTKWQNVSVLWDGSRLMAGSNGYVSQLHPATGTVLHNALLTSKVPSPLGDYETLLSTDGKDLYAGVHGYAYRIRVNDAWRGGGVLYHDALTMQGWRGSWTSHFNAAPATMESITGAMSYRGALQILATGTDGTLYHTLFSGGSWQKGWTANFNDAPTAMRSVSMDTGLAGDLEVFAVGTDGSLSHTYLTSRDNVWQPWAPNFANAPKNVSSVTTGRISGRDIEILAIDLDGTVFHNVRSAGSWQKDWTPNFNGAPKMNSAFRVMGPGGNLQVFGVGTDGTALYTQLTQAGWQKGWTPNFANAPTTMQSITAAMGPMGNLEVFGVATDGTLFHTCLSRAGWQKDWTPNFANAPTTMRSVIAATGPQGNLEVFGIATDGRLYHTCLSPVGWQNNWSRNFDNAPVPMRVVSPEAVPGTSLEVFGISGQ